MKAATYIKRMAWQGYCNIETAEKITKALHREGHLHTDLVLRFRPLFADFDILPKSWFDGNYNQDITGYYLNPIQCPENIIEYAQEVSRRYEAYLNS